MSEPSRPTQPIEAWELQPAPVTDVEADEALRVDVGGFEGPLDLLLALARTQKVDLSRISILALADQYLAFVAEAKALRLEVAGDYLVMAAWLAFLKSRLLIPRIKDDDPEPSGEELAQRLAFRLMRLEAMRKAAQELMGRMRLGRDVFQRGMPEAPHRTRETTYSADIYDLLKAYAEGRGRTVKRVHVQKARTVWSIADARKRLEGLIGQNACGWVQLDLFLSQYLPGTEALATVRASSFGASLELAREGRIELRQERAFAPIYVRRRDGAGDEGREEEWERLA